jgi:heme O synthase-like polyprenyltransferase
MSLADWACLGAFILGFILFVVGANIYNAIVGYTGLYLAIASIVAYLVIYIYKEFTKRPSPTPAPDTQNP